MILILNWIIFIMTFGMISIAETTTDIITLDTPIEELNDLTLNEVFDRNILLNINQLSNGIKYYQISGSNIVQVLNEYILTSNDIIAYTVLTGFDTIGIQQTNLSPTPVSISNISNNVFYFDNFISYPNNIPPIDTSIVIGTYIYDTDFSGILRLNVSTGTYPNLTSAKDSLTGTPLLYRLGFPITILTNVSINQAQLDHYYDIYINGGYYEYDAVLNDLDMTDFIIISSSFVLWLWFMRFVKGVL